MKNLQTADWNEPSLPIAVCALNLSPEEFGRRFDITFTEFVHDLGMCKVAVVEFAGYKFWIEAFPEAQETNFVSIFCPSNEPAPVNAIDKLLEALNLAKGEIDWVRRDESTEFNSPLDTTAPRRSA